MNADEAIAKWVKAKWMGDDSILHRDGVTAHEEMFGCVISISNVRFGTASDGACNTCYHEYPAILFDAECSCPKKVPAVKNPEKLRNNPARINMKNMDVELYDGNLSTILSEILG